MLAASDFSASNLGFFCCSTDWRGLCTSDYLLVEVSGHQDLHSASRGQTNLHRLRLTTFRGCSFACTVPSASNSLADTLKDIVLSLTSFTHSHFSCFTFSDTVTYMYHLTVGWNYGSKSCKLNIQPLTLSRAEMSIGYTLPSRSKLHFKFLTFRHSGAQP